MFTNRTYACFNRVYKDQLAAMGKNGHGSFQLLAVDTSPPKGETIILAATLQRQQ